MRGKRRIKNIFFTKLGILALMLLTFLAEPHGIYSQFKNLSQFERAKVSFKKGMHYFNSMQYLAAVEFFRKAVSQYPDYYTAREYLARAYKLSGFIDEALKEWQVLSEITSENITIQYKINTIRFRRVRDSYLPESSEFILGEEYRSSELGRYRFPKPVDLAIDGEKNIYVTSFTSGKIIKIDSNGNGVLSYNAGIDSKLYGIDIYRGRIAVSDFQNDRVYSMNLNFKDVKNIGDTGNSDGSFHGPEGICFDKRGNIYVVDSGNHRVQKFDNDGNYILKFGEHGDYEGQLKNPTDIVAYRDRLYVTDTGNKRISCFDDSGNFIKNYMIRGLEKPRGISGGKNSLLISDEQKGLLFYNLEDDQALWPELFKDKNRDFSKLIASNLDRDGFLYCLDYNYERIFVFSPIATRYTNLDVELTSVDLKKYPVIALYLNVRNRSGNPLYGLSKDNFKVVEDGANISGMSVDYLKNKNPSASIVLCVDRSLSNGAHHNDIPWVSEFILKKMRRNDSIKLLNFNRDSWVGNNFDWSRRRTLRAIRERAYGRGKNIGKALYNSINDLLPRINRRAVVMITNGMVSEDSFQSYSVDNIIAFANSHYIPIHFITFRDKAEELKRIANETGGFIFKAHELDGLRSLYDKIKKHEEYRYVVVYYSFKMSDLKGWWSDLKVEVNYKGQKGVEWGGYFVPE